MTDKKQFFNMLYEIAPGGVYAVIGILIRFFCEIIAISLFPGYSFAIKMISDLGDVKQNPSLMGRSIFNGGLIVSSLLMIPYFHYLGKFYKNLDDIEVNEKLRIGAIYTSIISSIFIVMVGFFLIFSENDFMFTLHGVCAFFGFLISAISNLLWAGLMLQTSTFSKWLRYYGPIPCILCVMFLFTWNPLVEWICAYSISFFILAGSINSLIKKY